MNARFWLSLVQQQGVIAVVRTSRFEQGIQMAKAVATGGIQLIEVTWNSDRAPDMIAQLRAELPHCWIGAGTLLTLTQQQQAIAVGAQFLFTPHVDIEMIKAAAEQEIPLVAGALSPTEIVQAWQAGAASVKVFPIEVMGGVTYIQALHAPLGNIPLIPTGGITIENTPAFLQAGAIAVGLSSDLFPRIALSQGNWDAISLRTQLLVQRVESIRLELTH
ncbi:bifunctional 4-hydroxy-2-oxoglutarate aldolase/2-dehydro-3-deoxy-phosphogluconate aldolase [Phormidium sp. CLA17]|uniref:bifunctional 4-hydroxy-2-oxoglutarate aldolase/2-dehydro-3-deoxy-phosphogluconate aldolase n=1 Tax=Leptolyngbya sp. Cla-17 TaxID=2803751 RepID=UPI0014919EE1|nr:bifunctional 4-hydroxy-2-oxoglutarate aldolase/2-dehydro-3-deoxy-phosphogluconate aldolase [Leptolyngbya sp. Cla-17]MBM0740519.1 bifunctional 4-hydroxy-2-oxoglutarate aldolase/2-dehydro-3-deoxy-phosphogluconate aldolase [Leptolyngbya sp. Cla-17]